MEITSFEDIEKFKTRVNATRLRANINPKIGFVWGNKALLKVLDSAAEYNQRIYSELPEEISLSKDLGDLLLAAFLDDLKEKSQKISLLEKKYDGKMLDRVAKFGLKSILTSVFPNPSTFGSAVAEIKGAISDMGEYSKTIEELAQKTDKAMQEVLSSYKLTKTDDGKYRLKRGKWHVTSEKRITEMGRGHTTVDHFFVAMKDIGVDINLVPTEQRDLLETLTKFPPLTRGK